MALQLMKLQVTGSTITNVDPDSLKFFHVTDAEIAAGTTLTIDAADFFLDDGSAATTLPVLAAENSYFTVSINGVLQMEGMLTYTPGDTTVGSLAIAVPAGGESILAGTPIVLEVVKFTSSSTTTIDT